MPYNFLADLLVLVHFAWIVFVLVVFFFTIRALWRPAFFERWIVRSVHLFGILLVGALEIMGKPCPLTVWENALRQMANPDGEYPGSFIFQYIFRLVYPDVSLLWITIPTVTLALVSLALFILRPPGKISRLFTRA